MRIATALQKGRYYPASSWKFLKTVIHVQTWSTDMYFLISNMQIMFAIHFGSENCENLRQKSIPSSTSLFPELISKDPSRRLYQHKCFPSSAYIFHKICMLPLMKYQFWMMCLNFRRHRNSSDRYPRSHRYLSWDSFVSARFNA